VEKRKIRLQKYMADCGVASRRKCEEYILQGLVTINGRPAQLGCSVDPSRDKVLFQKRRITPGVEEEKVYYMLNKPRGCIAAASDDRGRQTVVDLIPSQHRLYPVGRLDFNTEGLIFLTNDGDFAYALTHPSHEVEKGYEVVVSGKVTEAQTERLRQPFELDGYRTHGARVQVLAAYENKTVLFIGIGEGRNRQVRRMCEQTGLLIRRLRRVSVGEMRLGNLPVGKYRSLTTAEVDKLMGRTESNTKV
jgi:23S rRNA pseudouridine2605 synthase